MSSVDISIHDICVHITLAKDRLTKVVQHRHRSLQQVVHRLPRAIGIAASDKHNQSAILAGMHHCSGRSATLAEDYHIKSHVCDASSVVTLRVRPHSAGVCYFHQSNSCCSEAEECHYQGFGRA